MTPPLLAARDEAYRYVCRLDGGALNDQTARDVSEEMAREERGEESDGEA